MKYLMIVLLSLLVVGCKEAASPNCTVTKVGTVSAISCPDGTVTTVEDGSVGMAGQDGNSTVGPKGDAGSGCSVEQTDIGATISCGDTFAVITNGLDGDSIVGPAGLDGQNCDVAQTDTGAVLTCGLNSATISNGSDGQAGNDGSSGVNGLNSLISSSSASSDACLAGGTVFAFGLDSDSSGVLDEPEVSYTSTICSGIDGVGEVGPQGLPGEVGQSCSTSCSKEGSNWYMVITCATSTIKGKVTSCSVIE